MRKLKNEHGFVLLEVMTVMMIILLLTSALYGIVGMEHRRSIRKVREEEAYYAAMAAVRMMGKEVAKGEAEEGAASDVLTEGMGKRTAFLVFDSETGGEKTELPVTVWSERDGENLILAAEAGEANGTTIVTLRLLKEVDVLELPMEHQWIEATPSEPVKEEVIRWIPIRYETISSDN